MEEIDMQQELIEMLDKMVKYFDEIPSDSYYYRETGAILNEAEKLVEKAKNSAKEPAVPQGWKLVPIEPTPDMEGARRVNMDYGSCTARQVWSAMLAATPAAPSQPVTLTDRQFDLICQAIDKADTITMEGDYMMDSDDCIGVVRVMQALFSIAALSEKAGK